MAHREIMEHREVWIVLGSICAVAVVIGALGFVFRGKTGEWLLVIGITIFAGAFGSGLAGKDGGGIVGGTSAGYTLAKTENIFFLGFFGIFLAMFLGGLFGLAVGKWTEKKREELEDEEDTEEYKWDWDDIG